MNATTTDGLCCPCCGCKEVPVKFTRQALFGRIRRVRQCRHCGKRFTTSEKIIEETRV